MEIPKDIMNQIWEYCRLNNITDIEDFTIKMVKQGFSVEKYGSTPIGSTSVKEVEKIVEVVKEIPVEKIVEVIKEVPVEKIVEKEIYITDDQQINEMSDKMISLNEEINSLKEKLKEDDRDVQIKDLSSEVEKFKSLYLSSIKEQEKLNNKIEELNKDIIEVKKNVKKDDDIYGEKRKGWFGSNILKR